MLMSSHSIVEDWGWGLQKVGDESGKGTYRASWKKGGLGKSLGKGGLLGEVERRWDPSQWSCKAVVVNQR